MNQGMWWPLEAGKGKEMNCPLEFLEKECSCADMLILAQ